MSSLFVLKKKKKKKKRFKMSVAAVVIGILKLNIIKLQMQDSVDPVETVPLLAMQSLSVKPAFIDFFYSPKNLPEITVHSCYFDVQGTLRNSSRYSYPDISDLQN